MPSKKRRRLLTFEDAQGLVLDVRDIAMYMKAAVNTRNVFFDFVINVALWIGLIIILVWAPGFSESRLTLSILDAQTLWRPKFSYDGDFHQLDDVANAGMFWAWVDQVVLPQTFGAIQYDAAFAPNNCSGANSSLLFDEETGSHWLWGLRVRQLKATSTPCSCSTELDGILGGMTCSQEDLRCSDEITGFSNTETAPFPNTQLSVPVLDDDFSFSHSYTWHASHEAEATFSDAASAGYVVDIYYCEGMEYAASVVSEMSSKFLSERTRAVVVELFRVHLNRRLLTQLTVEFTQSPTQDWTVSSTPETTSRAIFLDGIPLASIASNFISVVAVGVVAAKVYFLDFQWAIAHGIRWSWLPIDGTILAFWVVHLVVFTVNWVNYDLGSFYRDVEDNRLTTSYTSGAYHASPLPDGASEVFNTIWLALASLRLCSVLILDDLSFTIRHAVGQRSCCRFQIGVAMYALLLTTCLCVVCFTLFNHALESFGQFSQTISTFVAYSMYMFRFEDTEQEPWFHASTDVLVVFVAGKFTVATIVALTYTALFIVTTQRANQELSDSEADTFGLRRKQLPQGFLDETINLSLGKQALRRALVKVTGCRVGWRDDVLLRHFSYTKTYEFFDVQASSNAKVKFNIRGLLRGLLAPARRGTLSKFVCAFRVMPPCATKF